MDDSLRLQPLVNVIVVRKHHIDPALTKIGSSSMRVTEDPWRPAFEYSG
jgi:hypothetical protein